MRKEPLCSGQGSVGRKKQGMAHASQGHLEDWMIMGRVRHLSPWGCRFGRCAAGVSNAPVTLSFFGAPSEFPILEGHWLTVSA